MSCNVVDILCPEHSKISKLVSIGIGLNNETNECPKSLSNSKAIKVSYY